MDQPKVTDFTKIDDNLWPPGSHSPGKKLEYSVSVKLDSGWRVVAKGFASRKTAEVAELAINQAMIEYRTKRNAWEKQV